MSLPNPLSAERLPPHSIEAERSVLGSMLIQAEALQHGLDLLTDEDFYWEAHRIIFRAMRELDQEKKAVDLVTLADALKVKRQLEAVGGAATLADIASTVPTAAHLEHYAKIVKERSVLRGIIRVGTSMVQGAYEGERDVPTLVDEAERSLFQLGHSGQPTAHRIYDVLNEAVDRIDKVYGKGLAGISTGFPRLDAVTSGLQDGDFIVIAARPGMGKTVFALDLARNAADKGVPTAIFSLEMSREQLAVRLICGYGGVSAQKLRHGQMDDEDWNRFSRAVGALSRLPIYIDDSGVLNILDLRARCRRLKAEAGIGLIIIDYLQLMESRTRTENRQQEISAISRGLKALARELDVPVVTLSQLSRAVESRQDHRPQLSDLRESGAIEQDADLVTFIYREKYYDPQADVTDVADIIIAKQRNGPLGTVRLAFLADIGRFYTLDERAQE